MHFDATSNETRTNTEQSETGGDFRVSFESDSVVYFLGAENGLVKIGFATVFHERLGKLQCGSPVTLFPLAIVRGGRVEERNYHERYKRWRHHGEWFELTDELEEEIDRLNAEQTYRYKPHRFRGLTLPLTLTREAFPW